MRGRRRIAFALNLIAPGAGLVILRREWLGLSIAILFAVSAQLSIWGFAITPGSVPRSLAWLGLVVAGVVWAGAQWLGYARAQSVFSADSEEGLRLLCEQADIAVEQGRFSKAHDLLTIALRINDEDIEIQSRRARVLMLLGQFAESAQIWERVLVMNPDKELRREAIEAIEKMPRDANPNIGTLIR